LHVQKSKVETRKKWLENAIRNSGKRIKKVQFTTTIVFIKIHL